MSDLLDTLKNRLNELTKNCVPEWQKLIREYKDSHDGEYSLKDFIELAQDEEVTEFEEEALNEIQKAVEHVNEVRYLKLIEKEYKEMDSVLSSLSKLLKRD